MQSEEQDNQSALVPVKKDDDSVAVHPVFDNTDGDVILAANGGSRSFRVHSFTLKTTSGFFRSMFSLPQEKDSMISPSKPEVIYLQEDEATLEHLLRMACGLPILPMDNYDLVESVLDASEKYDMPGPMSIIRLLVTTQPLSGHPLRLYAIACRFGWEDEAKLASTQSLEFNLHNPELRPLLQKLSTTAILNLFDLHRSRREGLRQRLNDPPFVNGGPANCNNCRHPIDYHTWRELKYKIILEMDFRPLGDTIINYGLQQWAESQACWSAKCQGETCQRNLYDREETLRVIRECIETLPKTIAI